MLKESPKQTFSFHGIVCSTLGHNYVITKKITNHINEYQCTTCNKEVTDNLVGKLENLTYKNKAVNSTLASFFEKKRKRSLAIEFQRS